MPGPSFTRAGSRRSFAVAGQLWQPQQEIGALAGVGTYEWRLPEDALRWSTELLNVYGVTSAPEDRSGFFALVHPEDRARVEAEVAAFLADGTDYEHEFRIVRPDGGVRVIHDRGMIERDGSGAVTALRGVALDVTRQRQRRADAAPESNVAYFHALADHISQLAWMADGTGWIYWYNRRWFDYTGTTLDEMAGWGWTKVHHPDHVDRVVEKISRSFQTGEPWEDTFPLRGADGEYRWFLSRALPVRGDDGTIACWFGTNTDVTEQREAERQLREGEERFRALAESMPQLVWTAGNDGRVDYYNSRVRHYAVSEGGETAGWLWKGLLHERDLQATMEAWYEAAAAGQDYAFSHRLRMADGSYRWHLSRAVPVAAPGGTRWYGTATDIHDLREAQEHRQLLISELNHRVKNTLTLVQSVAQQTFRKDDLTAGKVDDFAARLRALAGAHDILTRESWQDMPLAEAAQQAVESCGISGERVVLSGPAVTLPSRTGVVISMAIHELCTNAIKYGALSAEDGTVSLDWTVDETHGRRLRMEWRERGGPTVSPPVHEGFGSRLIKRGLAAELDGSVSMDFRPEGLICIVEGHL
ncbi:MAG: PAS domain-containing protein [Alphaproteobacteria bacterium]|nr:PAS domain-containing protein [Alphaproteobacteria bacterium]